jgi:hypothetical protein
MCASARRTHPIKHHTPVWVNPAGHGNGLTLMVIGVGVPQLYAAMSETAVGWHCPVA